MRQRVVLSAGYGMGLRFCTVGSSTRESLGVPETLLSGCSRGDGLAYVLKLRPELCWEWIACASMRIGGLSAPLRASEFVVGAWSLLGVRFTHSAHLRACCSAESLCG